MPGADLEGRGLEGTPLTALSARIGHGRRKCGDVVLTPPIVPMLAEARRELPPDGALPGDLRFEAKWDGFRAIVFARPGHAMIQSRSGADLTDAFPEIAHTAAHLGQALVLDGELVVAHEGRLHFGELQRRARRRGRSAVQAAADRPANLGVFDVLEQRDTVLVDHPYRERRALLEDLIDREILVAPFTLIPATGDRSTAQGWLDPAWGAVGVEGCLVKGLDQPYQQGKRGWVKVRSHTTAEAVIGGVTGTVTRPLTLLLARYDQSGELRLVARTTPLATAARRDLGSRLTPADTDHPWRGRRFSVGWGTRGDLQYQTVRPELVVEYLADTAVDDGRHRHPVRFLRIREEMHPTDVPRVAEADEPPSRGDAGKQPPVALGGWSTAEPSSCLCTKGNARSGSSGGHR
ncbi:ATP-dependent DNA ligase [Streptomyces sp. NPDC001668]|uniref:ATP-dependent DNA ligase n=1 Tax=Streptomyces sp. NPDC001668 TaxID=3364598 RepID=UPI0036C92F45